MFGIEQNVDLLILTLPLGTLPLIQISNTSCLHYVNKDKLMAMHWSVSTLRTFVRNIWRIQMVPVYDYLTDCRAIQSFSKIYAEIMSIDYLCVKHDWVNLKSYKKIIYSNLS